MQKILPRVVLLTLLTTPFATWALFKPVRVLAPALPGLLWMAQGLCVDDLARLAQAGTASESVEGGSRASKGLLARRPCGQIASIVIAEYDHSTLG